MNAAIYARKSTDQTGVADEQKSVARQLEHARQYAARKGWTVRVVAAQKTSRGWRIAAYVRPPCRDGTMIQQWMTRGM